MSKPPCPVSYLASQADWEGNSAFAPPAPFSSLFLVPEGRRAAFPAYRPHWATVRRCGPRSRSRDWISARTVRTVRTLAPLRFLARRIAGFPQVNSLPGEAVPGARDARSRYMGSPRRVPIWVAMKSQSEITRGVVPECVRLSDIAPRCFKSRVAGLLHDLRDRSPGSIGSRDEACPERMSSNRGR